MSSPGSERARSNGFGVTRGFPPSPIRPFSWPMRRGESVHRLCRGCKAIAGTTARCCAASCRRIRSSETCQAPGSFCSRNRSISVGIPGLRPDGRSRRDFDWMKACRTLAAVCGLESSGSASGYGTIGSALEGHQGRQPQVGPTRPIRCQSGSTKYKSMTRSVLSSRIGSVLAWAIKSRSKGSR